MKPLDPIKEERIIEAVFTIAGIHGIAGINIARISKEAGIGVGSIYTYFKNKEELIQAAYVSVEDKITKEMYAGFDINIPVKISFKRIFMNTLKYRLRHYNETVFIDQYVQSNYVQLNFDKQIKDFEIKNSSLYDLIQKGQKEGVLVMFTPFTMICYIIGAIRSASNGIAQKFIPLQKQVIDDCFNMMWKGISS
ncbi:TetR/AcrR family transcriptional regulator [Flavobacterium sp. MC2016-06]|jgi:AcrR family transcriptional regulator|uniref:TetR/AcrR family transcriptional regulator n=1 Tax=Flavobacterium sp. MC2016-06 TaxID=2676308 RepID=UPI0012BABB54|nr:TetR/AcrR family transcriptional regulator [Flavobacterium sp. MC2016-06]MBU3860472.1 TetR/AcrR family transcriptional regulator [Flavobacterium sp. MC2016-06]